MSFVPRSFDSPLPPDERGALAPRTILGVSAVTAMIKDAVAEHLPPTLHVLGQISNFKRHSSGHLYFTLKDDESELACVMWRSAAGQVPFVPQDGMEVIATGYVDVFERAGRYQLYCRRLEPRGVGALELAFRQLRDRLQKEGLFDPGRKKPIPRYPQRIAVVTSPSGAAVRDILRTLERRYPPAMVLFYPVAVQGPQAAGQIAAAVADLNRRGAQLGGIDVMIVGRGGGSLEDLWAFNEEVVARAIYASIIPVISAVGHETDVSIADLVADVRAATPTAAAELAVPDAADLLPMLDRLRAVFERNLAHRRQLAQRGLEALLRRRTFAEPATLVRRREQAVDEMCQRMTRTLLLRLAGVQARMRRCEGSLQRIQPAQYSMTLDRALADRRQRLGMALFRRLALSGRTLHLAERRWESADPGRRLPLLMERVSGLARRLDQGLTVVCQRGQERASATAARLSALDYRSTLRRGFSITRTKKGRRIVRDPSQVAEDTRIVTETAGGEFESKVIDARQMDLFE